MDNKKMLIKNLKYLLIVGIIIVIYFVFAFFINGKTPVTNASGDYLIVGKNLILQKKDGKWQQLSQMDSKMLDKKYTIYDGEEKIENVKIQYASKKWYFFNEDYENIDVDDFKVAFNNNTITPAHYQLKNYSEDDARILNNFLSSNDQKNDVNFQMYTSYVEFDFDNDGTKEKIYTTSNVSLSEAVQNPFSAIFMVKDNQITQTISKDTSNPFRVYSIIDIDGDGNYELIVTKGVIDIATFDSCYQIYKMNNGKWERIKGCENNE